MTEQLTKYKAMKASIDRAKGWQKHLSATSRTGDRPQVTSIGAAPTVCIQYTTGGKNYWDAKEEAGEVFLKHLNELIAAELGSLTERAIGKMEADLDKLRDAAKAEYLALFGEAA